METRNRDAKFSTDAPDVLITVNATSTPKSKSPNSQHVSRPF